MNILTTEVLVVGGGTGGTAAAIQSARRGAQTLLVSEFPWLGGMLTSAGVAAPDGNELAAFQTGIWGAFLRELQHRQPGGLDHAWVSFFTYDPRIGAQIFADWVAALPNLHWIQGEVPREVLKQGDRITGVRFETITVQAQITLDGTELGDLLALAEVPHRWGWEWQSEWGEPSAPTEPTPLTAAYPVQSPTWVVILQDYGLGEMAPEIPAPPNDHPAQFEGAWENYGGETFLNYGRLPGNRFMINWPIRGNDYGEGVQRLIGSEADRRQFFQEARWHSQSFARFIQQQLGRRYGLAEDIFPQLPQRSLGGGAYALHPYFRESRRLQGIITVREQDILPMPRGCAARLPVHLIARGCLQTETVCEAIAIGNYANDHHYPGGEIPLRPKSMSWGGRWTGTPFTIPYRALIPATVDGLLVCEKNISVSHIANGATRLQPLVLGIGQASGMAAALCVEQQCQPRALDVRLVQDALLSDRKAPVAILPLTNVVPEHPNWHSWQQYYRDQPEAYPASGEAPNQAPVITQLARKDQAGTWSGLLNRAEDQSFLFFPDEPGWGDQPLSVVTLRPEVNQQLQRCSLEHPVHIRGNINRSGNWLLAENIQLNSVSPN
jgi:hypothetical protein